ncbi:MAG: hypothetical protein WCY93_12210 [Anaerolineaceae bacterium]
MFEAIVIVCAINLGNVDYESCQALTDLWGPHVTQENCEIRTAQMIRDMKRPEFEPLFRAEFGNQDLIVRGVCRRVGT